MTAHLKRTIVLGRLLIDLGWRFLESLMVSAEQEQGCVIHFVLGELLKGIASISKSLFGMSCQGTHGTLIIFD